jgi:hypothetical protein
MTTTTAPSTTFDREALELLLQSQPLPEWAEQQRRAAMDRLDTLALPDRRQEDAIAGWARKEH